MRQAKLDDVDELKRVLSEDFGIVAVEVSPVSGGMDNTVAKWSVVGLGGDRHFVKVSEDRFGVYYRWRRLFDSIPDRILKPVLTTNGLLPWGGEYDFWVHVFPDVEAQNGLERPLTWDQVREVGRVLRSIHDYSLTVDESHAVRQHHFEEILYLLLDGMELYVRERLDGSTSRRRLLDVLLKHEVEIEYLSDRIAELEGIYQKFHPLLVPCHSDLHVGNILTNEEGEVLLTDWDTAKMAPRECDLIFFIGGGIFGHEPWFEEAFWEGYGKVGYDRQGLNYFRYVRVAEDIYAFSTGALDAKDEAEANVQIDYLEKQFLPGSVLSLALADEERQ